RTNLFVPKTLLLQPRQVAENMGAPTADRAWPKQVFLGLPRYTSGQFHRSRSHASSLPSYFTIRGCNHFLCRIRFSIFASPATSGSERYHNRPILGHIAATQNPSQ